MKNKKVRPPRSRRSAPSASSGRKRDGIKTSGAPSIKGSTSMNTREKLRKATQEVDNIRQQMADVGSDTTKQASLKSRLEAAEKAKEKAQEEFDKNPDET